MDRIDNAYFVFKNDGKSFPSAYFGNSKKYALKQWAQRNKLNEECTVMIINSKTEESAVYTAKPQGAGEYSFEKVEQ